MVREEFNLPTNPYHSSPHCLGGRWKMTILHGIHTCGSMHWSIRRMDAKQIPIDADAFVPHRTEHGRQQFLAGPESDRKREEMI